jgi:hypothetical protein
MQRLTLFSCAVLVGCASSKTTTGSTAASPSTPLETVRVSGSTGGGTMMVETHPASGPTVTRIGFPVDRVWGALKTAFDSLAIPVSSVDPATHAMGNAGLRIRRRLGDVAVSKYINCGNTQAANAADSYEVILTLAAQVLPTDDGMSRLATSVGAQGRPITLSSEYTRCTSTGLLETRLAQLVTAQLNR